jgi:hypothetical protein
MCELLPLRRIGNGQGVLQVSSVSPHLARLSVSWDIDGTPGHGAIRPSPEALLG